MLVGKSENWRILGKEGPIDELHPLQFGMIDSNYKKLSEKTWSAGTIISEITAHFTTILAYKRAIKMQIWNEHGS